MFIGGLKMKPTIKETIVVEGKDDVSAVKSAVNAHIIITNGLGINEETIQLIREASKNQGVIIFTDPDSPGNQIRNILNQAIPGLKHAYLPKKSAIKKKDVGIENASPEAILLALNHAKATQTLQSNLYSEKDLLAHGLTGCPSANEKRKRLGELLHIGECSAKQLVKRLNAYAIHKDIFLDAIKIIEEEYHVS